MSQSATTAAKRRRAGNIVASPLFRSNTNTGSIDSVNRRINRTTENLQNETVRQLNTNVPNSTTTVNQDEASTDFKKPMSLQQVITVFDKRLLTLEKAIIENKVPLEVSQQNVSINNELTTKDTQKLVDTLREDLKVTLTEQSKEFDYRTNLLANEITNLKEIVIKLQSYTLEVNKTLYEEREQFYQESENNIHIEADEKLNEEDLEVIDNNENISMELTEKSATFEHQEGAVEVAMEKDVVEEEVAEEKDVVEEEVAAEKDIEQEVAAEEDIEEEVATEEETTIDEPAQEKKSRRKKKDKKSLSVDL